MNKAKISVLVPIYNNADFVDGCIKSVVTQSLEDIEILLLDDGSTDQRTIDIIDFYAKEDSRIKVDRHRNIGCGATLNRGLKLASGTYIAEIDGDDKFLPDALLNLWKLSENGCIDLVKGTFDADVNGEIKSVKMWDDSLTNRFLCPKLLDLNEQYLYMMASPAMWTGIYLRSWLLENNIHWLPTKGAMYQDTSFSFIARARADLAKVENIPVYLYNLSNDCSSVKQKMTVERFDALRNEYANISTYLKQHKMNMWEIYARVRYGSSMWMISNMDDDDTVSICLSKLRDDLSDELIYEPYYSPSDIEVLISMGLI